MFNGYWTFFSCVFYNIFNFFNIFCNKNEKQDTKSNNSKIFEYVETYIIKPIFYTINYTFLLLMLLLFAIIKIIKYLIELMMDFVDKDETKIYDRFIYDK